MQMERPLSMNLPQKAGASSTHSKRWRAVSVSRRFAKRLECVRLADAFGSWSRCAVAKSWKHSVKLPLSRPAATLSPARSGGEGRERGRNTVQGFKARALARRGLTRPLFMILVGDYVRSLTIWGEQKSSDSSRRLLHLRGSKFHSILTAER